MRTEYLSIWQDMKLIIIVIIITVVIILVSCHRLRSWVVKMSVIFGIFLTVSIASLILTVEELSLLKNYKLYMLYKK